jgi:hypothetical protein
VKKYSKSILAQEQDHGGRLRKVKLGMVVHLEFEKTPLIPILLKNIPIHIFKARILYPFIYYDWVINIPNQYI